MNSKITLLAVLALAQTLIVLVFLFSDGEDSSSDDVWLTLNKEEVDALRFSDGESTVDLVRGESGWQIGKLPADGDKVDSILAKLTAINEPWPVATSADAAARFELEDDNFQREVVVSSDGSELARLLFGTSPGYQKVHARRSDSEEIYSVGLSNYELPVNVDGWLDKALLALSEVPTKIEFAPQQEGAVAAVEQLELTDEGWLYNGGAANQDNAATYAQRFKTLRVLGPAGDAADSATVQGVVTLNGDTAGQLTISRLPDEGDYLIARDEVGVFRLATYVAEQLLMTDVDFTPDPESSALETIGEQLEALAEDEAEAAESAP